MNDLLGRSSGDKSINYAALNKEAVRSKQGGGLVLEMQGFNTETSLELFFQEVEDIKQEMDKIKLFHLKLKAANEESKKIHKSQTMKILRDRMDSDLEQVLKFAKSIKAKLEELDEANDLNRKIPGCGKGTPSDRTRTSITNSLRKKLVVLMEEFQLLRRTMIIEYRHTIERSYFTITGENPDAQTLEQIIETGDSEDFLRKAIQEQGKGHIMETIREIQERHEAVKEINRNLQELHQIFLDMAVLVDSQGEQLNDIEAHLRNAASFVAYGMGELHSAKEYKKSSKCLCISIVLLLILIVIIVVPIAASLRKKK